MEDEEREKIDREIIEYNNSSCRHRKMLVNNRKNREERHTIRDRKMKINRRPGLKYERNENNHSVRIFLDKCESCALR